LERILVSISPNRRSAGSKNGILDSTGFSRLGTHTRSGVLILGLIVIGRGERTFWAVSAGIVVLGGFAVWLLGRGQTSHVGASGVIFGYFGYLVALGVIERSVVSILRALVVGLFYGSIIWGVFPNHRGVSWEGHLFGLLAGIALACLSCRGAAARRRNEPTSGFPTDASGIR